MQMLADFNPIWPIIILWVVAVVFGKKKKGAATGTPPKPEASSLGGLGSDLVRALEQLKAAETAARGVQPSGLQDADARARAYIDARKKVAKGTPQRQPKREVYVPKAQRGRPLSIEDHAGLSLEGESQETGEADATDFDDEAQRIVEARYREATEAARARESDEDRGVAATQAARAAPRAQEPVETAAATVRRNRLARFATGRMRDAVVLNEILGRPKGDPS